MCRVQPLHEMFCHFHLNKHLLKGVIYGISTIVILAVLLKLFLELIHIYYILLGIERGVSFISYNCFFFQWFYPQKNNLSPTKAVIEMKYLELEGEILPRLQIRVLKK